MMSHRCSGEGCSRCEYEELLAGDPPFPDDRAADYAAEPLICPSGWLCPVSPTGCCTSPGQTIEGERKGYVEVIL